MLHAALLPLLPSLLAQVARAFVATSSAGCLGCIAHALELYADPPEEVAAAMCSALEVTVG